MKYKIDFNNGKVFETYKDDEDVCYQVHGAGVFTPRELETLGATITEIKEPIKFECDVEWCEGVQMIIYPKGRCYFHGLVGKRGKLTFIESEE